MGRWTDGMVREALGLEAEAGGADVAYAGVGTDTRAIEPGALFVALRGERFDAHDFLAQAVGKGARGLVVERAPEGLPGHVVAYVVPDTLAALGALGRHWRRRLRARVCAVAGSNGKTTTKEMAKAVLAARYRVHATTGNLNNLVGVPLTLLAAPEDAEALVVEVGTNVPGEVARLASIVEPDAAIITSIGEEHLEGLGSLEGVLREESSVLEGLRPDGFALVADEPPELGERARELAEHVHVAGWTDRADEGLRAEDIALDEEGRARFRWAGREVRTQFRGRVQARNALLALGLGLEWGVEPDRAVEAIGRATPAKMRSEVLRIGDLVVIADCYNANPASMDAAIDLLEAMPRRGGRVAVVGTMKELGRESAALHRRVAERLAGAELDLIVATGDFVGAFEGLDGRLGDRLVLAGDPLDAYAPMAERMSGDEVVLLKGSRGVALERLLPELERDWGADRSAEGGARAAANRGE